MEIVEFTMVNKNSTVANFSIKVNLPALGPVIFRYLGFFQKGERSWVGFPTKYLEENGNKKFIPFVEFEKDAQKRFLEKAHDLVKEYMAKQNIVVEPKTPNNDLPF